DLLRGKRIHLGHLGPDLLEFGAVSPIVFLRVLADRLAHALYAISGIWMVAKELWPSGSAFLFQLGKELGHFVRVVTRVVHDLRSQKVGLTLGVARVFQKQGLRAD